VVDRPFVVPKPADHQSVTILGRDQTITIFLSTANPWSRFDLTDTIVAGLHSDKSFAVVFSRTSYTDVFQVPRTTYVCKYWRAALAARSTSCPRWNSAT
jgi:hypothetical protein